MKKAIGIGVGLFLVLSLGIWFLLTNAHIDIFPCSKYEAFTAPCGRAIYGTCSMMAIYGDGPCAPNLAPAGYLVALLVMILLPAIIAGLVARRLRAPRGATPRDVTR